MWNISFSFSFFYLFQPAGMDVISNQLSYCYIKGYKLNSKYKLEKKKEKENTAPVTACTKLCLACRGGFPSWWRPQRLKSKLLIPWSFRRLRGEVEEVFNFLQPPFVLVSQLPTNLGNSSLSLLIFNSHTHFVIIVLYTVTYSEKQNEEFMTMTDN